jgi:hypothetical protein
MSNTNSSSAKKMAAIIRRHATVFDIKRKALAAASIRPEEVRERFAHPTTIHGKPRHQLRALFVISSSHARGLTRSRLFKRKGGGTPLPTVR